MVFSSPSLARCCSNNNGPEVVNPGAGWDKTRAYFALAGLAAARGFDGRSFSCAASASAAIFTA